MKTSHAVCLVGLTLALTIASVAYSLRNASRVHELARRLQQAEAQLQLQAQSLTNNAMASQISNLEKRLQAAELAASHVQAIGGSALVLEQRIQSVEQKVQPRSELPSPLDPYFK